MTFLGAIGEISRCYALFRNNRLEEKGLVGYQSLYVNTICRNPGISQEQLADLLIFNKSSVARQLASLEEKGFVRRERSPQDKRILLVYPTEKAEEVVPYIHRAVQEFRESISQGLTEEEMELLDRITKKVDLRAKEVVENL